MDIIHEIYESQVKPLSVTERLELMRLIMEDLTQAAPRWVGSTNGSPIAPNILGHAFGLGLVHRLIIPIRPQQWSSGVSPSAACRGATRSLETIPTSIGDER
mgnify:FL=1